MDTEFRQVNRALSLQPKVGPFDLYQVLVFVGFGLPGYYLKELLGFSWLIAGILVTTATGIFLVLLGKKPWLFFSRIKKFPNSYRAGVLYYSLIEQEILINK